MNESEVLLPVSPSARPNLALCLQHVYEQMYEQVYDGRSQWQIGCMLRTLILTLTLISSHLVSPVTQTPAV